MADKQDDVQAAVRGALEELTRGQFVLTSAFDGKRAGVLARSVQPCAHEPPLICVAVRTGHWIEPLIRDSHAFAVCRVGAAEKLLLKKFAETSRPRDGDPFDCVRSERFVTASPVIASSALAIDCEVVRHLDLEADHELFIGHVLAVRVGVGSPVCVNGAMRLT